MKLTLKQLKQLINETKNEQIHAKIKALWDSFHEDPLPQHGKQQVLQQIRKLESQFDDEDDEDVYKPFDRYDKPFNRLG